MSMLCDIKLPCPNCERTIEQTIDVPSPNFGAEKLKDSGKEFWSSIICEHCQYEIEYYGSNNFYEIYMTSDEVAEEDFHFGQPEYEFDRYEIDESLESQGIAAILSKRKIESLYHFSKVENIDNIALQGIVPRSKLKKGEFQYTDLYRTDGFLNANCISVSFPQYKMFYRKRVANTSQNWVIFEVSTDILLEKERAFFERNAASRQVKNEIIENRKSATAFEKMFGDIKQLPSREKTKIPDCYPTDPQAEILVFDRIENEYIIAAHFASQEVLDNHQQSLNGITGHVTPALFENRMDF